jgi:Arc/MetJ-type ribon-helix-helix transcriptional regulator
MKPGQRPTRTVSVRLPKPLDAYIQQEATQRQLSRAETIRRLLEQVRVRETPEHPETA